MTTFRQSLWDARYVLMVAGAVLGLKAVYILMASMKDLSLTSWIIDDAFIEMAVARNIALGYGFTYDFVHPTTGSPFLWTYMMAPLFLFSKAVGIKLALILSGLFATLATLVVYFLTQHLTKNTFASWIAFLLATFTGNAFFEAINGMDTASFTFFTVLAFAFYCGLWTENLSPLKRGLLTGVATALALLTRGDGLFVAGTIGLLHLIDLARGMNRKETLKSLMGFIATAFIGWAIMTAWQISVTGSPFLANQIGRREIALGWHNFSFDDFQLLPYIRIVIWNIFQLEMLFSVAIGATLVGLIALFNGLKRTDTRQMAVVTTVYLLSFGGALVAYQWYFPDFHGLRYINPAAHLFFVLMGVMAAELFADKRAKIWAWVSVVAVVTLSWYSVYNLFNHMPWTQNTSFFARPSAESVAAVWKPMDWMRENLPKGSIVGVRDHGRMALFSELPIQDIAGNIDPNVPAILHQPDAAKNLLAYFHERNVTHLLLLKKGVRNDKIYQVVYKSFPLEEIPAGSDSGATLYRIAWERTSL